MDNPGNFPDARMLTVIRSGRGSKRVDDSSKHSDLRLTLPLHYRGRKNELFRQGPFICSLFSV